MEYEIKFAEANHVSPWGQAVFVRGGRKITINATMVELEEPVREQCAACWRLRKLQSTLTLDHLPPSGLVPVEPLLLDALFVKSGNKSTVRLSCLLCDDCSYNRNILPQKIEWSDEEEEAEEVERAPLLSTETNIGAPVRYADDEATPAPASAGSSANSSRSGTGEARFEGMSIMLDDRLAAELGLTPHDPDAKPIGERFEVLIEPPLGPLAMIRIVGDDWSARGRLGEPLDMRDARIPVLRNIAFGACDLLAEQRHERSPVRYVDDGSELPTKKLRPTHHIKVKIGLDLRNVVVDILEGRKTFEAAMEEAIFVRGHWVNQPCGPDSSERRRMWRRPHHRGRGPHGVRTYELGK